MKKKRIARITSLMGEHIVIGGKRFAPEELIAAAVPRIRDRRLREEIERFLKGGPFPSQEALAALEAAIYEVVIQTRGRGI